RPECVNIRTMVRQYLVPAVTRALEVIELLSKQDAGMSISEIHRALRLPLSSAANIVYTLKSLGYLERSEEGSRYRLSLKMLGISRRVLDRMDFLGRCHGQQGELVAAVSATGTIQQIPKNRVATTGALVKKYAHLMSARLGGSPDSAHA